MATSPRQLWKSPLVFSTFYGHKSSRIRQGTLERLVGLLLHRVEDERDAERQQRRRQVALPCSKNGQTPKGKPIQTLLLFVLLIASKNISLKSFKLEYIPFIFEGISFFGYTLSVGT